MKIKIFKDSLVQKLKESIDKNIERYQQGQPEEFRSWLEHEYESDFFEVEIDGIDSIDFSKLNSRDGERVQDDVDVKLIHQDLAKLSPSFARDPRLWATLCHMYALPYIRMRNPQILSSDPEVAVSNIRTRFFIIDGARGFERTNALARLWWYGHIAEKTGLDFNNAVDALVEDTDRRASTIERPTLAVCGNYMTAMAGVFIELKEKDDKFFNSRDAYRPMMKSVFEMAGRKFFPAMEPDEIKKEIVGQIALHRQAGK